MVRQQLIPRSVRSKLAGLLLFPTPVWWARWGRLSEFVATSISPRQPPLVVLCLPRSGSSWVGEILGSSPDSLYLREPFSQSLLRAGPTERVEREVKPLDLPPTYRATVDDVARALPRFGPDIVRDRRQWRLAGRRRKRVVVKAVNPLMLGWLLDEIEPRVVYLVRHPAAVADSYHRLGWTEKLLESRFGEETLRKYPGLGRCSDSFWSRHGAMQAIMLHEALGEFRNDERVRVVRYEDVCRDPSAVFRGLYDFAELPWTEAVEQRVAAYSNPQAVDAGDFGVLRDSAYEMKKWKHRLSGEQIREVRDAWLAFDPPCYREDDW